MTEGMETNFFKGEEGKFLKGLQKTFNANEVIWFGSKKRAESR